MSGNEQDSVIYAPDIIRISERVHAKRMGRFYYVRFPYSEAAVKTMGSLVGASWDPRDKGWHFPWHRAEILERAMARIDAQLRLEGIDVNTPDLPLTRELVIDDGDLAPGRILDLETGPVAIGKVGVPFTGTRSLARSTGKKVTDKPVRYVWHRPALESELAARAVREEGQDEPIPEPS
ncbi:hypothetical protein ACEUZ9_001053 [Paracoccus litorisediminis]|uniref:hypothetical protein n=1 Tax=Paracoccus litorisediminis TaxID=2006130 RepID=UPI00372E9A5C